MTDDEHALALALAACRFSPASFSKRFARDIHAQASGSRTITDRQARRLRIQAYIYRRQMPAHLVPATPPEGYETPSQREAGARLEAYRAAHPSGVKEISPGCQPGVSPTQSDRVSAERPELTLF